MPVLRPLRRQDAPALLVFEQENRGFFAKTVSDRGDDFFARFDEILAELVTDQEAGLCRFHLLVGTDGEVLGRVNLMNVADGTADLGYRVAEHATGRGLATWGVREVCALAANAYGLTALRAAAALSNTASRSVLARTGFTVTGETELRPGHPALTYVRDLGDLADTTQTVV